MALAKISPRKYGKLLATTLPKVIETRKEFDRYVATMERLDRSVENGGSLSPEEHALLALLERLIQDYDDRVKLPDVPPLKILQYLTEQRGLRQADLLPIFGSRSVTSDVINGKRDLSKAHIRRLAEFFHVSPEVFL
jgi:HTH-type transcriptional regulator / antitoxin HigA